MSKGHNPFEGLKSIRSDLPPGSTTRQDQLDDTEGSTEIRVEDRAGRAPYNFVRMAKPKEIAWLDNYSPPSQATYVPTLRSGHIDLELKALTDFYIRGTWLLKDYPGKEINQQERPFEIACKLRLPGSSLRGMIRGLVEILAYSPLDPINKSRLAYRTIGSSANPNSPAFEPCAPRYRELIEGIWVGTSLIGGVKGGYLNKRKDSQGVARWFIRPAIEVGGNQIYKISAPKGITTPFREAVYFDTPVKSPDPRQRFLVVPKYVSKATSTAALAQKGWLVCSGDIEGRRYQWIINEPHATKELPIPVEDFEKHQEADLTKWIEKEMPDPKYRSDGIPVFYIHTPTAGITVWFGSTYYFRLPYLYTTHDFNRAARFENSGQVDLAQAIFGYKPYRTDEQKRYAGQRGRVFFEDALELEPKDLILTKVVLGEPRPSIFQHYLEQRSENPIEAIHWDTKSDGIKLPKLRGFKVHWHRPGAQIREWRGDNPDVASTFLRVKCGARFTARVRYDNLNDIELGALLTAIELPNDCAHHLGMGKPLGLGSFKVTANLLQIGRDQRYTSFFDGDQCGLNRGLIDEPDRTSQGYKLAFSRWILDWVKAGKATADIWSDPLCPPRLLDLRRLLTFEGLPHEETWQHATRYLEFGKIQGYNRGQTYNEYQAIGWPGAPTPSRRRPLPPPLQVFKLDRIPKTKRPNFDKS